MNTFNDNFKIAFKAKNLFFEIYNLLENIMRKDFIIKEKLNTILHSLLENIFLANYEQNNPEFYFASIKSSISLIDFYLEILYHKKYISLKQLETQIYQLTEINKMITKWITHVEKLKC